MFKFNKSLVTAILLCGCETWNLLADSEKKDPGFRNQVPKGTSPRLLPGAQDQRLGAAQDQLPCGSTGTSSSNCQETDTRTVQACQTQRQPLQNQPSRHLGGWATPWSAEERLDGQYQRMDISAHKKILKKNCSQGPPAEKTGRGSMLNRPLCPYDDPIGQETELN